MFLNTISSEITTVFKIQAKLNKVINELEKRNLFLRSYIFLTEASLGGMLTGYGKTLVFELISIFSNRSIVHYIEGISTRGTEDEQVFGSQSMLGPKILDPEALSVFYRYSPLAWRAKRRAEDCGRA